MCGRMSQKRREDKQLHSSLVDYILRLIQYVFKPDMDMIPLDLGSIRVLYGAAAV